MNKIYTPYEFIRNIYKETSIAEKMAIENAVANDVDLREEYDTLQEAYRRLPKVLFSPSPLALASILSYSAATAIEHLH